MGATILPVWPTCISFGTKPESTAALEAPIAAPNLSAIPSRREKFSPFCIPLPPEITISAEVNSGLSDSATSSLTKEETPRSVVSEIVSTEAVPPSLSEESKLVVLTVITFIESELCTVAIQLPAYIGLSKVSSLTTALISEIWATSNKAAALGKQFFPLLVAAAKI